MNDDKWGLAGIFQQYAPKDLIKDLWLPILFGIIFAYIQSKNIETLYDNLGKLIDYAIVYLPVMATIILTAYTMMIGALKNALDVQKIIDRIKEINEKNLGDEIKKKMESPEFEKKIKIRTLNLLNSISAALAANIVITVFSLGFSLSLFLIYRLSYPSCYAHTINIIAFGLILAMIIYPIRTMVGIVSDMYSISKFT